MAIPVDDIVAAVTEAGGDTSSQAVRDEIRTTVSDATGGAVSLEDAQITSLLESGSSGEASRRSARS